MYGHVHHSQERDTNFEASRLSTLGRLILGLFLLGLLSRARRQALLRRALGRLRSISLIGRHVENSRADVEDLVRGSWVLESGLVLSCRWRGTRGIKHEGGVRIESQGARE